MMFHSLRIPHLALRIALAAVFMWFGIDKFIDPMYWINAWLPGWAQSFVAAIGMESKDFIFLNGILEVLISVSLVSGYFIRIFSAIAAIFLASVIAIHIGGPTEIIVRDIGLLGGLLALLFWPERTQWE